MYGIKKVLETGYLAGVSVSPFIGANYVVWTKHEKGDTIKDFAINAVTGAFWGAIFGILSPIVVLGIPSYVTLKTIG